MLTESKVSFGVQALSLASDLGLVDWLPVLRGSSAFTLACFSFGLFLAPAVCFLNGVVVSFVNTLPCETIYLKKLHAGILSMQQMFERRRKHRKNT